MGIKVNFRIISALARRDLRMYFSNPSGYVFITLFIFLSAAAAFWQERFFLSNLANLDQLNALFPYLLLFLIPALTMAVWSEERKLGTDELLLTLPATDLETVLGKYLATLGIYTASLVLSLSYVLVLVWLGSPDLGLMVANYVGYWLLGAALIAVGMLASLLTANVTIAFILGAALCAFLIFLDTAAGLFSDSLGRLLVPLVVFRHFDDFAKGVLSLSGVLYFASVAGFLIYLNVLLISRRHWPLAADGYPMWVHHTARAVSVAIVLISISAVVGRGSLRLDVTAERLHSLSDETRRLLGELSAERPVFIQAFISPTVPEPFVQTRSNLLSLLGEIDAVAGPRVEVLMEDTEPFTDEARNAREKFGITPRQIPTVGTARAAFQDVFMGLAFTCGAEEQVIPFFDRGLPAEYEIARSMRVVARTERRKVGLVDGGLNLFGRFNFETNRPSPRWSVVSELEKQYEVVEIDPAEAITQEVDGLLVVLPSSVNQAEMDHIRDFIEQDNPALLLVDPLPALNPRLSPSEQGGGGNPFSPPGQPQPGPRGDVQEFLSDLGVRWEPSRIVWDGYNPHPELAHLPSEVVFLGEGNENEATFNHEHRASAALQELVLLYPGHLEETGSSDFEFEPLLRSGQISGTLGYFSLVQPTLFGPRLNPSPRRVPDDASYILAAHVRSVTGFAGTADSAERTESPVSAVSRGGGSGSPGDPGSNDVTAEGHADQPGRGADGSEQTDPAEAEGVQEEAAAEAEAAAERNGSSGDAPTSVNVMVVADLDFIGEQFFDIRAVAPGNLNFDNVTFFLNAMDTLMGDDSFIDLRSRRARHRTLERVEVQTSSFIEQRTREELEAEEDAEQALKEAQQRLDERVRAVEERDDIDEQAKQIMARNLQEVENRRLDVLEANIEAEKNAKIQASRENMESQIQRIQSTIRTFAVMLPPVPVFVFGLWIFVRRQKREREGAAAARRLRE